MKKVRGVDVQDFPDVNQTAIDVLIEDFYRCKQRLDELSEDKDMLQEQIIKRLNDAAKRSQTTVVHSDDGELRVTAEVIQAVRERIDEPRLKKALGTRLWAKVTSAVLDKKKLEDAIVRGLVDGRVVTQCSDAVPNRPYIKLNVKRQRGGTDRPYVQRPAKGVTR